MTYKQKSIQFSQTKTELVCEPPYGNLMRLKNEAL